MPDIIADGLPVSVAFGGVTTFAGKTLTMQKLADLVRQMLQDEDGANYRYTDSRLYTSINAAFAEAYRLRRDLFLANNWVLPYYSPSNYAAKFPIDEQYFFAIASLATALTQLENDRTAPDSKASMLLATTRGMLQGGA